MNRPSGLVINPEKELFPRDLRKRNRKWKRGLPVQDERFPGLKAAVIHPGKEGKRRASRGRNAQVEPRRFPLLIACFIQGCCYVQVDPRQMVFDLSFCGGRRSAVGGLLQAPACKIIFLLQVQRQRKGKGDLLFLPGPKPFLAA